MRVDVVGRSLEITDAIREHAEGRAAKLPRYFDGTQQITFTISRADDHHGFHVELIVDVEKSPAFVSHATDDDLYAAIDMVTQKGVRQLTDFKEKLKVSKHR